MEINIEGNAFASFAFVVFILSGIRLLLALPCRSSAVDNVPNQETGPKNERMNEYVGYTLK